MGARRRHVRRRLDHARRGRVGHWYALPPDGVRRGDGRPSPTAAADPVTGSTSRTASTRTSPARRSRYTTAGRPTAYVTMPHHRAGDQPDRADARSALPERLRQPRAVRRLARSRRSRRPCRRPARSTSPASGGQAGGDRRALRPDVAGTPPFPSDTYFGGKALNRAATLVVLGEQLGVPDVVAAARDGRRPHRVDRAGRAARSATPAASCTTRPPARPSGSRRPSGRTSSTTTTSTTATSSRRRACSRRTTRRSPRSSRR